MMSVVHVTLAITVYHSGSLHYMIMYIVIVTLSTSFSKQEVIEYTQYIHFTSIFLNCGVFRVLTTL